MASAKLFITGRSQAVKLPNTFRFQGSEVFIRRDPNTGEVVLTPKSSSLKPFFELTGQSAVPAKSLMLDTVTAGFAIAGGPPGIRERLAAMLPERAVISTVTQAELLFNVARSGHPAGLAEGTADFLGRVGILAWDVRAATIYGNLRGALMFDGVSVGAHEMMLAAHAIAVNATLVTREKVFSNLADGTLTLENWIEAE